MKRAQAIKSSAFELGQQIGDLRRVAFKTQLALNTGSILGIKFWAPVVQPSEDDVQRLDQFNAEMKAAGTPVGRTSGGTARWRCWRWR